MRKSILPRRRDNPLPSCLLVFGLEGVNEVGPLGMVRWSRGAMHGCAVFLLFYALFLLSIDLHISTLSCISTTQSRETRNTEESRESAISPDRPDFHFPRLDLEDHFSEGIDSAILRLLLCWANLHCTIGSHPRSTSTSIRPFHSSIRQKAECCRR